MEENSTNSRDSGLAWDLLCLSDMSYYDRLNKIISRQAGEYTCPLGHTWRGEQIIVDRGIVRKQGKRPFRHYDYQWPICLTCGHRGAKFQPQSAQQ